jgi:4-amino-4-deoxy-L-arabinose transferase-like glycosyltransferase
MGWRRLTPWLAVGVGIAFVAAEVFLLDVRIRDFDEGVYWQSIRALARGEPLFRSVFASQPPAFYYALLPFYAVAHSLASLRLAVLILGLVGLAATYLAGRLLAGPVAGLIAVVLGATSSLYFHESAIVQADGPSVAMSMVAVALALLATRTSARRGEILAALAGASLALAIGIKFLGAVTVVPIAIVLLSAPRPRRHRVVWTFGGVILGTIIVALPALLAPRVAFDDLVLTHLLAGSYSNQGLTDNAKLIFLHREIPLEALAFVGVLFALVRHDRAIVMPLVWVALSIAAILFYHPLFVHHVVMLSLALALTAGVGLASHLRPSPRPSPGTGEGLLPRGIHSVAAAVTAALVIAAAGAGVYVEAGDVHLARVPDLHDSEMAAAVRAVSRPDEFWISDNPFAVAAANRNIPGPLVDTSTQRTHAGLLTVDVLESNRVRYHVHWLLEDSFRLDVVPGYGSWLIQHFHAVENLGGRAVVYQAN